MKHFNKRNIYISLFAILYLCTAFVSTLHAISFFSLANELWLGIILACTFEIGQAAVLFSILTDKSNHKKVMPWILMCILTLVQILGNVFSSYKYILTNSIIDLKYFKEPIFVWTELPDNITTVIVTYIIGAILPIVALSLTSMVTGYLDNNNTEESNKDVEELQKQIEELQNKEPEVVEKEVVVDNPEQAKEIEDWKTKIEELQNKEPEIVEKEVVVDNPEQAKEIESLKNQIEELQNKEPEVVDNPEQAKEIEDLKTKIEELKNKEPEVVEKEVVVDNPEQAKEIENLKNQIEELQNKEPEVVEKEVVVDNPEQAKEIERLKNQISEMQSNNKVDKESHFVNL